MWWTVLTSNIISFSELHPWQQEISTCFRHFGIHVRVNIFGKQNKKECRINDTIP